MLTLLSDQTLGFFTGDVQEISTENNYPVVNFANFNLRTGRPSGRFNLTKFDGKFEQVIGDIYGIDASRMPKHKIIYTIIEPTQTNPNWTLIHGKQLLVCMSWQCGLWSFQMRGYKIRKTFA